MTSSQKNKHSAALKARVASEALSQIGTIAEIASKHGVHPTQVVKWKNHLKEHINELFTDKRKKDQKEEEQEELILNLYQQIGRLTVERDWIKKKSEQISS